MELSEKEDVTRLLNSLNKEFQMVSNKIKLSNFKNAADFINKHYAKNYKKMFAEDPIEKENGVISTSVLKKYWMSDGTICLETTPSKKTLNYIVIAMGYKNIDDYICSQLNSAQNKNLFFDPLSIDVDKLDENQEIIVGWEPYHYIKFRYLGDYLFEILQKSDTFKEELSIGQIINCCGFGVRMDYYWDIDYFPNHPANYDINEKITSGVPLFPQIIIRKKNSKRKAGDFTDGCYVLG